MLFISLPLCFTSRRKLDIGSLNQGGFSTLDQISEHMVDGVSGLNDFSGFLNSSLENRHFLKLIMYI